MRCSMPSARSIGGRRPLRQGDRHAVVGRRGRRDRTVRRVGPGHRLVGRGRLHDARRGSWQPLRWGVLAIDPPLWARPCSRPCMPSARRHPSGRHPLLTHAVPEERAATAQGVYAAMVAGLVLGSVTVGCGPLYRLLGGEAYGAMALLALIGASAAFALRRRWHGGPIVGAVAHRILDLSAGAAMARAAAIDLRISGA